MQIALIKIRMCWKHKSRGHGLQAGCFCQLYGYCVGTQSLFWDWEVGWCLYANFSNSRAKHLQEGTPTVFWYLLYNLQNVHVWIPSNRGDFGCCLTLDNFSVHRNNIVSAQFSWWYNFRCEVCTLCHRENHDVNDIAFVVLKWNLFNRSTVQSHPGWWYL